MHDRGNVVVERVLSWPSAIGLGVLLSPACRQRCGRGRDFARHSVDCTKYPFVQGLCVAAIAFASVTPLVQRASIYRLPLRRGLAQHDPRAFTQASTDKPTPRDMGSELVKTVVSTPKTYSDINSGVRLRVGPGCLSEGQVAGPITVMTDKRFIVKNGQSSFLVSLVVDCQPSGASFQKPLSLEFCLGEEDGSREVHLAGLQDTYQFFWRAGEGKPWMPQDVGAVSFDEEIGKIFYRGNVSHFSQGCLGKNLNLECDCQDEVATTCCSRPRKREIEFVNATDRRVTFLVLPTGYSDSAISSWIMGVQVEQDRGNLTIERAVRSVITNAATDCQAVTVPARSDTGQPRAGQRCPYRTCHLPRKVGPEARVVMVTIDDCEVFKWINQVYPERSRVVILPRMFSNPEGCLERRKLETGVEGMARISAPVASVFVGDGAGGHVHATPVANDDDNVDCCTCS